MANVVIHGLDKWKTEYQRNNKQSGIKNLRCFPFCLDTHRDKGFCGQPINITVERRDLGGTNPLHVWAEFGKVNDVDSVSKGTIMKYAEIEEKQRTRKMPFLPWFVGLLKSEKEEDRDLVQRGKRVVAFEFNNQKFGWNYGWVANKHTCNSRHCVKIYIFEELRDQSFRCLEVVRSPSFTLFCRRRPAEKQTLMKKQREGITSRKSKSKNRSTRSSFSHSTSFSSSSVSASSSSLDESFLGEFDERLGEPADIEFNEQTRKKQAVDETNRRRREQSISPTPLFDLNLPDPEAIFSTEAEMRFMTDMNHDTEYLDQQYSLDRTSMTPFMLTTGHDEHDTDLQLSRPDSPARSSSSTVSTATSTRNETFEAPKAVSKRGRSGSLALGAATVQDEEVIHPLGKPYPLLPLPMHCVPRTDPEIPESVVHLFGDQRSLSEKEKTVNRTLWRLCVILTILDSHWKPPQHRKRPVKPSTDESVGNLQEHPNTYDGFWGSTGDRSFVGSSGANEEFILPGEAVTGSSGLESNKESEAEASLDGDMRMKRILKAIQGLAIFFIEEQALTTQLRETLCEAPKTSTIQELRSTFLTVTLPLIRNVLMSYDVRPEEFDHAFPRNTNEQIEVLAAERLRFIDNFLNSNFTEDEEAMPVSSSRVPMLMLRMNHNDGQDEVLCSVEGEWSVDDDVLDAMDKIRERVGMTWVFRKMTSWMERNLKVKSIGGVKIYVQTQAKLISSSKLLYVLDGEEHKFMFSSPIPIARGVIAVTYRGWFNAEGGITVEHYYGEKRSSKSVRTISLVPGKNADVVQFICEYHEQDPITKTWNSAFSQTGFGYRIGSKDNIQ